MSDREWRFFYSELNKATIRHSCVLSAGIHEIVEWIPDKRLRE